MGGFSATSLRTLPVATNPGYAIRVVLDRLQVTAARAEKAIAPSFFKRLLGGNSKDHARGVVASCMEDAVAIRSVVSEARKTAISRSDGNSRAMLGSADRIMAAMDAWRDAAVDFEEAIFGSEVPLLAKTRKLLTLCVELRNPASGLG